MNLESITLLCKLMMLWWDAQTNWAVLINTVFTLYKPIILLYGLACSCLCILNCDTRMYFNIQNITHFTFKYISFVFPAMTNVFDSHSQWSIANTIHTASTNSSQCHPGNSLCISYRANITLCNIIQALLGKKNTFIYFCISRFVK